MTDRNLAAMAASAAAPGMSEGIVGALSAVMLNVPVLTARQAGILLQVYLRDGDVDQGELATATGLPPYVISRAITIHERLGYVARVRGEARLSYGKTRPPRAVLVGRTAKGQSLIDAIVRRMQTAVRAT